ncbi:iron complex transport system substrate-binding protein [Acetitomaculum ruminis DSM 5522]|uniref:Iron complex transport system substrate-binding protein n=1 Tax=Acetitomaculum ruminis DSM 5522 TaxID=1120918 RepID=A0A1I0WPQ2_9FIRM|nr:ABC transporter substrate-binding protein [Acetitomaculum ruminis]SFA90168.1 iron complex transport system substrate-binding protein [Acetitomaculum ruminis DSM 5522]
MRKKFFGKQFVAMALCVAMTVGTFAGCGSKDNSGDAGRISAGAIKEDNKATSTNEDTSKDNSDTTESSKKTEYPVTITTYGSDGSEIETTYEKAPEKVVAVYQGCIETLLALGLEDKIVATAGLDNEVPDSLKSAFSKTKYLDEFTPSKETITMLEPDMIFSWGSYFQDKTLGDTKDWIDKGVNVYINSNTSKADSARTLENEYNDILNLGIIFDVQDKAEEIVNNMKETIETVTEKTKDITEKPSVMILESYDDTYTNYGSKSLGGDMVTSLGATLANADASEVGKEDIVTANPDIIFVVYMPYTGDDPETLKNEKLAYINDDEALKSVKAIEDGHVYPIMLSEMYAAATRTQDGINTFAKGLYPDLDLGLN